MGHALTARRNDTHAAPRIAMFAASGAVALALETAWFRSSAHLFGASHYVAASLLAVFMAGMALGAALGPRLCARFSHPLRAYGTMETLVSLVAFASPATFAWLAHVTGGLNGFVRVAAAAICMLPATVAMGATLPMLVAAAAADHGDTRRTIGTYYAANAAGAVAGVVAAGYWLLPTYGTRNTVRIAAGLALAVGVSAWQWSFDPRAATQRRAPRDRPDARRAKSAVATGDDGSREAHSVAWALALGTGAVSFALQVSWNRLLANLLGSASFTFTTVVAVTLISLSLGGWRARRARAGVSAWRAVSLRLVALAIGAWISLLVAHAAPLYLATVARTSSVSAALRWGVASAVVALPAWHVGALFPSIASLIGADASDRAASRASFAFTVGNVSGAIIAGYWTLPRLGLEWTVAAACLMSLGLAALAAFVEGIDRARSLMVVAAVAVLAGYAVRPRWDFVGRSAGAYRVARYREQASREPSPRNGADARDRRVACGPARRLDRGEVLFRREGLMGTVVVIGHRGGPDCSLYSLRVNGKAEGSAYVLGPLASGITRTDALADAGDTPSQVAAGLLPAVCAASRRRAFVVGWGTGITVRTLLDAGVDHVDAAEIEPAVLEAARLFDTEAQTDRRVRTVVDDARVELRRAPAASFDVIVSHPSNPWVAGASALFSREYFQLARSRLAPGGAMLAWAQLYETDRDVVRSIVATFVAEFPDTHAFVRPGSRDLLLLGRARPRTSPVSELLATISAGLPTVHASRSIASTVDGFGQWVQAAWRGGGLRLALFAREATIDTDDNGYVEFRAARRLWEGHEPGVHELLRGLGSLPAPRPATP